MKSSIQQQTATRRQTATHAANPPAAAINDQRPEAAIQRRLQDIANNSPQAAAQRKLADLAANSPRTAAQRKLASLVVNSPQAAAQRKLADLAANGSRMAVQRKADEEEMLQGKFDTTQRIEAEEDELLQGKFGVAAPVAQREEAASLNRTGLPDQLKAGVESLSGLSMDDVRVHYNSDKPAQLQALAYTQGSDIHVAPGQEQHLAHEAWHVVQQKQGRVRPTMQMKEGVPVNDDAGLEKEADVMGTRAAQMKYENSLPRKPNSASGLVAQRVVNGELQPTSNVCWAAVGWAIHKHKGGTTYATLRDFVDGMGTRRALTKFDNNKPADIDEIIGSLSGHNRLAGSDSAQTYGKNGITQKLKANQPIVANVNGNHYIILTSARTVKKTLASTKRGISKPKNVYMIEYMDPADGALHEKPAILDPRSRFKVVGVNHYFFTVLYYTE